jgi:HD superfamily phosphohydrolase
MDSLLDELKKYAAEHNLSRKEIAVLLGVPEKTVQPWFTGGKSHYEPSAENQDRIKKLLHPEVQPVLDVVDRQARKNALQVKPVKMASRSEEMIQNVMSTRGKTIRDPIQMDIELKPLEVKVIDTDDFQRLRHIKQLGTANLVFPGATHTRFEHSLGTVATAQVMINAINNNPDNQLKITDEITRLIRICALLHDITHMPYGHTLEDEGFLYARHDKIDKDSRLELFLGHSSQIGQILGDDLRREVIKYLSTPREQVNILEHPYIVDIVGNTVCADLIDYLARDTVCAGLKETFDPRFLKNLLIASYESSTGESYKDRLVLSLIKQNRVRRDVISEVMHLLRLRYSLAEKVYYHHAKIISSAMIIEAVQAALISKPSDFDESKLCKMRFGDDELLMKLGESKVTISVKLVGKLSARKLYKPFYMLSYSEPSAEDRSWETKLSIIQRFRDSPRERYDLERTFEKWNDLPEGSVIIYCPTEKMNLKQIETLCLWHDGEIMPLVKIPGGKLAHEAKSINDSHQELWKLYVFVERDLKDESKIKHNLAIDCRNEFNLPNCLDEFPGAGKHRLERYIETWAENRSDLVVTISEKNQLIASRSLYKERGIKDPPSNSDLEADLKDIRRKN